MNIPTPETVLYWAILLLSYSLIGGGLKYIDQAYDAKVFSKKIAWLIAIITATVMGGLIALDAPSATILLAVIIGVAVTRKIDAYPFYLGVIIVFTMIVLINNFKIMWTGLLPLLIAGMLDEEFNNMADKKKFPQILNTVFHYRPLMKLTVLGLAVYGMFGPIYFLAFLLFDLSYIAVEKVSESLGRTESHLERGGKLAAAT